MTCTVTIGSVCSAHGGRQMEILVNAELIRYLWASAYNFIFDSNRPQKSLQNDPDTYNKITVNKSPNKYFCWFTLSNTHIKYGYNSGVDNEPTFVTIMKRQYHYPQ